MSDECQHIKVGRCYDGHPDDPQTLRYEDMWVCEECGYEFIGVAESNDALKDAVDDVEERIRQHNDTSNMALDMIAGVFAGALFDLQERTLTKYGVKPSPEFDPEQIEDTETTVQRQMQDDDCRNGQHEFNSESTCRNCGAPKFLGGG